MIAILVAAAHALFINEQGLPVSTSKERIEHDLIRWYIPKSSCGVLELGARYGTSSCAIAKHLNTSSRAVSVEAMPETWSALEHNLRNHSCNGHLVRGVVSTQPLVRENWRSGSIYTTRFVPADHPSALKRAANDSFSPAFTPAQLERQYGLQFDAMVADCEGCFESVIDSFPHFVARLNTLILEGDNGIGWQKKGVGTVNYSSIVKRLDASGLALVKSFPHPCCRVAGYNLIVMMVFQRRRVNSTDPEVSSCS